jgi:glycosyltransferase involved in cell wall biosynthesis
VRHWSYSVTFGLEEGISANDADFFTVPVISYYPDKERSAWLTQLREMVKGRRFDQVWVELIHSKHDADFFEWLATVAPVRLGFLGESLEYSQAECEVIQDLVDRRRKVEEKFKYITHVLACDEKDAERINAQGEIPAMWWPQAIARQYFGYRGRARHSRPAKFCGAVYGERADWLINEKLKGLMVRIFPPPENYTLHTIIFNRLQKINEKAVADGTKDYARFHNDVFMRIMRYVRRSIFIRWLKALKTGGAVVNLPHYVKTYAGRVVEAMAVGCPVISWEIPDRPRNRALFEEGKEILLYPRDSAEGLAEHIEHLRSDGRLAQQIADRAHRKALELHTMEKRVAQIFQWIDTGGEPDFS